MHAEGSPKISPEMGTCDTVEFWVSEFRHHLRRPIEPLKILEYGSA